VYVYNFGVYYKEKNPEFYVSDVVFSIGFFPIFIILYPFFLLSKIFIIPVKYLTRWLNEDDK
jgi:hypothetical protein